MLNAAVVTVNGIFVLVGCICCFCLFAVFVWFSFFYLWSLDKSNKRKIQTLLLATLPASTFYHKLKQILKF